MEFGSLEFIIIFLPVVLLAYHFLLGLGRAGSLLSKLFLFGISVWYYYSLGGNYIFVLVELMLINFIVGLCIRFIKNKNKPVIKGIVLWLGILVDIGTLCFFRIYEGVSPVGLSFFAFTQIAYIIDVYRDDTIACKSVVSYLTYSMMFPKIVQGPVTRYENFRNKLKGRRISLRKFDRALKLFILGLAMKVIVADNIGILWNDLKMIGYESISTPLAWLGMAVYSLQLYYDFAGYSLMAMGLGGMMGFSLPVNFDTPYASSSISEFYRRWHMTLGQWFKDYIYIPLGGNRKGTIRTVFNLFVVWLLTGLWHGITLNFIIWGLSLFFFIALEKLFLMKVIRKLRKNLLTRIIPHLYVLFVIPLTWMVFAISDIKILGVYMTRLFPFLPHDYMSNVNPGDFSRYITKYGWVLGIAVLFSFPKVHRFVIVLRRRKWSFIVYLAMLMVAMYFVAAGTGNGFMYAVF